MLLRKSGESSDQTWRNTTGSTISVSTPDPSQLSTKVRVLVDDNDRVKTALVDRCSTAGGATSEKKRDIASVRVRKPAGPASASTATMA